MFFLLVEKENWDGKPWSKAIRQIYSNDKIQKLDSELRPVYDYGFLSASIFCKMVVSSPYGIRLITIPIIIDISARVKNSLIKWLGCLRRLVVVSQVG